MFNIDDKGNISIIRENTGEFSIDIVAEDGELYELQEGDILTFTVKKTANSKKPLIEKNGNDIFITPEDTRDLDFGKYVYDVRLEYDNHGARHIDTIIPIKVFEVMEAVTWKRES